ncbi:hypothetical protein AB0B50_43190 [Streptomyces sp. NPDC041068]|uniref:hypothetical protein n=1 Tax=Streptomyces sp. NPDC041068 TaxID=3155130 RepID=UPI0033F189C9
MNKVIVEATMSEDKISQQDLEELIRKLDLLKPMFSAEQQEVMKAVFRAAGESYVGRPQDRWELLSSRAARFTPGTFRPDDVMEIFKIYEPVRSNPGGRIFQEDLEDVTQKLSMLKSEFTEGQQEVLNAIFRAAASSYAGLPQDRLGLLDVPAVGPLSGSPRDEVMDAFRIWELASPQPDDGEG